MASSLTAPTAITTPFANSGSKRTVPVASQIGVVDGQASFTDGFPPLNATPIASGGVPPSVLDMNGILNIITANIRYLLGGCIPKFNATLASTVGGYPIGAILQDNTGTNCYRNLVDGNSTDFNTDATSIGVSWELIYGPGKTYASATTSLKGIVELATTAEAATATDTTRAVTPAGLAAFLAANLLAATTSAAGKVELATTTEAATATDTTRAVTPAGLASFLAAKLLMASETVAGKVELATTAETQAGTDTTRAVTPAGLAGLARSSVASGGYSYEANGDLVQWGIVADTAATFSFPVTFYSVFGMVANPIGDNFTSARGVSCYVVNTSTFRVRQGDEVTSIFYVARGRWRA